MSDQYAPSPEEDAAYEALETAIRAYARITHHSLDGRENREPSG